MCVFLFRSPRVLKMTSEREKETRVDESKKKRRKDHFFFISLQTNTRIWQSFGISVSSFFFFFFFFAQNTNTKRSKNFVRLKIYMDVWI